ncbi:MAG: hypothetical protein ACYTG0_15290 [Planctomycetota bacterium]
MIPNCRWHPTNTIEGERDLGTAKPVLRRLNSRAPAATITVGGFRRPASKRGRRPMRMKEHNDGKHHAPAAANGKLCVAATDGRVVCLVGQ